MSKDRMNVNFVETTIALADTTMQGFIDDFYASNDVSYTPASMEIQATIAFKVKDGSNVEKTLGFSLQWFESASVINTRLKNIWAAFTAGLTAMEAASSFTTVMTVSVSAMLEITYS